MVAAIPLRDDFNGPGLRALAKASKDAKQTPRLWATSRTLVEGTWLNTLR